MCISVAKYAVVSGKDCFFAEGINKKAPPLERGPVERNCAGA